MSPTHPTFKPGDRVRMTDRYLDQSPKTVNTKRTGTVVRMVKVTRATVSGYAPQVVVLRTGSKNPSQWSVAHWELDPEANPPDRVPVREEVVADSGKTPTAVDPDASPVLNYDKPSQS